MTGFERFRRRLPPAAIVLLLVLVLMMLGFACACLEGTPVQQADRAGSALAALPGLVEMWAWLTLVAALAPLVVVAVRRSNDRASPAVTQRFLF